MSRTDTLTVPAGHDRPDVSPPAPDTAALPAVPGPAVGTAGPAEEPDALDFELPAGGLDDERRLRALDSMDAYLTSKRRHLLGYQATQEMGGGAFDLGRFMHHNINNLGDPFRSGGYKPNTKVVERAVLDYYAALWHAKGPYDPADPESYWGYVLSMGSTEGNMYALWNARDYLSGKALIQSPAAGPHYVRAAPGAGNPNAYRPVAFYSEDTHYSFAKAVHVLGVETFHAVGTEQYPDECPLAGPAGERPAAWPAEVPSRRGPSGHTWDGTGEIDVDALAVLVEFFAAKGHPVFVSLNLGSTFKGAHDDVREVCERLLPIFERHGLIQGEVAYGKEPGTGEPLTDLRRRFWIHVDGALGAGYAPFLRMAAADPAGFGWTPDDGLPEFDFGITLPTREFGDLDMVSSIAMSGHKWPGAPWPCGIYMTKVKYQISPPSQPEYIGAPDTTFAGSRNGFSPLILWDHLSRHSYQDQVDRIRRAQELAAYLERQLHLLEQEKGIELWPARTPGAITVRFRKPSPELVAKWSLSSQDVLLVPGDERTRRSYVHVFLMSSVDRAKLDELLADLAEDHALLAQA
ncbi:histidine decarboxylase [Kitasatospora indigofera]|uniref:histidine decarboxylase n=1 Tax=Kitasatospora indigofera TaxID=67307 RepID=UPI0036B4D853